MSKTKEILKHANLIVRHQEELSILKGENFNLFSILKMESRENDTHSSFLFELLNPKGSHNLGTCFLNLFFRTLKIPSLDIDSCSVIKEYNIGPIDQNMKIGGRIDLQIQDKNGRTVTIENKIYARDQDSQIERYCNFNPNRNFVYYLTLNGDDPSLQSKGNKKEGEDYINISYRNEIINWLDLCVKEASEFPILRETLRQYIILIKKLTNQLTDNQMQIDIQNVIANNYKAAKVISSNIEKTEIYYAAILIKEISDNLKESLNPDWIIEYDENIGEKWTGINIKNRELPGDVELSIQGQPYIHLNQTVFGITGATNENERIKVKNDLGKFDLYQEGFNESPAWPFYKSLFDFTDIEQRLQLFENQTRIELAKKAALEIVHLAKKIEESLIKPNQKSNHVETPQL